MKQIKVKKIHFLGIVVLAIVFFVILNLVKSTKTINYTQPIYKVELSKVSPGVLGIHIEVKPPLQDGLKLGVFVTRPFKLLIKGVYENEFQVIFNEELPIINNKIDIRIPITGAWLSDWKKEYPDISLNRISKRLKVFISISPISYPKDFPLKKGLEVERWIDFPFKVTKEDKTHSSK
jgi:hypothetical protein